ncbi:hypothetical protein LTR10_019553 [Elasticomyces elasticus]|uniref:Endonuclease/exonuclease/phosphatase domain-containing protein n=1 Tax=Exophiala sideris TaxID=1016849 RepID=A0ABR0J502_9EURO|nr:hypothetical protein LTR10_019553 [Elasticomyces elasticus]KAK5028518.1 hypothetical protein LTS07_006609 [Exophiala sideris]KAK5035840.1 hypothetical protein LTR13_005410 [Exophiala sideris]KAK5056876.1 hypothetical protein LTR69_007514 [Exophiala sideris]KAK5181283.1 hypothetical protein LTR44_006078 [Eurotiomycetes sp. CCFEE 6388]
MSSPLKRSLSTTGRSISPPPLQRKIPRLTEHVSSTRAPPADHLRIFSWNVNGVGPLLQKQLSFSADSLSPLRTFLKRHHWPQFLCLQEVKISSKDTGTQRRLQAAANECASGGEPTYTIEYSLPRDKHNATGFGGKVHGVATLIRDDFGSRLRATRRPDWDLEGRVLIHELDMGLVVINGYWVNGTLDPYRDPETGRVIGTRHDHKLRFHQWMLDEVLRLERPGLHVILIGDMNIARARIDGHPNLRTSPVQHVQNRADFNAKFFTDENGLRAIDIFRHQHGDSRKYTYRPRGKNWGESGDRVDLIVVSRSLVDPLDAVADTDICDNAVDRGHSDHVPLWISLNMSKLSAKQHNRAQVDGSS